MSQFDIASQMPYSVSVETVGPGRFVFPRSSQFSIEGIVPSMSGLTSRQPSRQRMAAHGGHFAMPYYFEASITLSSASISDGCWYCGDEATEWDHIVPRKLGGEDIMSNLIPSCSWCNSHKNRKTLGEFRACLRKLGRNCEFDTPDPYAIEGTSYFIGGVGWQKFVSNDGRVVLKRFKKYISRMPHMVKQK